MKQKKATPPPPTRRTRGRPARTEDLVDFRGQISRRVDEAVRAISAARGIPRQRLVDRLLELGLHATGHPAFLDVAPPAPLSAEGGLVL